MEINVNLQILYRENNGIVPVSELYEYNSIPIGYIAKFKFTYDKKNNWLDLSTKDQRVFKFRFDNAMAYQNAMEAFDKHCQNNKH